MQEGGDRGKGPNKTGTQPKKQTRSPKKNPSKKTVGGASSAQKRGRRKAAPRTTKRSGRR